MKTKYFIKRDRFHRANLCEPLPAPIMSPPFTLYVKQQFEDEEFTLGSYDTIGDANDAGESYWYFRVMDASGYVAAVGPKH